MHWFQKFLLVEFISKIQKKIKDVAYFQINTNILIKKGFLELIDLEKGWLHFAQTLKSSRNFGKDLDNQKMIKYIPWRIGE